MENKQFSMEEIVPLILEVIESGGEFRLSPRGTSMLPLLREGRDSVVLVSPAHPTKRDIYLYRRENGTYVLHRLLKLTENGEPIFCGDNQTVLERGVPRENILARVCAIYRGEKRISVTAFRYRLYVALHCFMPWRYLRFFPRYARGFLRRLLKNKKKTTPYM